MRKASEKMRALLDANFLIALLDADHVFYKAAIAWFAANRNDGWASCPLTQNAFIRISSNPGYSGFDQFSVTDSLSQLDALIEKSDHQFWADDISLLDGSLFDSRRVHGPRQLTDVYLLALATGNNAKLVTFDERIPISAVRTATNANLCVVG